MGVPPLVFMVVWSPPLVVIMAVGALMAMGAPPVIVMAMWCTPGHCHGVGAPTHPLVLMAMGAPSLVIMAMGASSFLLVVVWCL